MDEAQMVYNFALPPLVVHTFRTGDTRALATWAAGLTTPSPATTLFNILASHDGIGLVPASGLLHEEEIAALVETTLAHGGRVSFKSNPDGSRSPYELNITLYDALNDPRAPDDPVDVQRFLAAQAIMLSLPGVPAVYIHSLLGSRNDQEGTARAGRDRAINRRKFGRAELERELARPGSLPGRVLHGYRQLLRVRRAHPAFHPQSGRQVLDLSNAVWAQVRGGSLLDLVNVSREAQSVTVDLPAARLPPARLWHDLIGGASFPAERGELTLSLAQYQASWLVPTP
jgi:sucrose phosphorylase